MCGGELRTVNKSLVMWDIELQFKIDKTCGTGSPFEGMGWKVWRWMR